MAVILSDLPGVGVVRPAAGPLVGVLGSEDANGAYSSYGLGPIAPGIFAGRTMLQQIMMMTAIGAAVEVTSAVVSAWMNSGSLLSTPSLNGTRRRRRASRR
jgi:hypothetical protein